MNTSTSMLVLGAAMLSACAQTAPSWESRFGDATRQAAALRVIDPDAPSRSRGPMRTDGKAVSGAMTGYAQSFGYAVKEAKQPEISIAPANAGR